ncbi:MAG: hypothetical protein KatS3mg057_3243 [Herpetosiphonaceae bacterium]|nr:MAG: hypothetical protein KatS3mg057_3243 [Herpetosiphonaceae bacterium]
MAVTLAIALQESGERLPASVVLGLLCVALASLSAVLVGILVKRRMDRIAPPDDEMTDASHERGERLE